MSMMKSKKRKKSSRFRGTHTHGRGFKKKARGKGHRGGVGMAGTGKRGDQKKTLILNQDEKYFGKQIPLAGRRRDKTPSIDLRKVLDRLDVLIRKGIAKDNKGSYEIDLKEYKVLSTGNVDSKIIVKAKAASKSAIEKVKKAGGSIELVGSSEKEEH